MVLHYFGDVWGSFWGHLGVSGPLGAYILRPGAPKTGPRRFFIDFGVSFGVHVGSLEGTFSNILGHAFPNLLGDASWEHWGRFLVVLGIPGALFFQVFWKRPKK